MIRERFLSYLTVENLFALSLLRDVILSSELLVCDDRAAFATADRLAVSADALAADAADCAAGFISGKGCFVTEFSGALENMSFKSRRVPQLKKYGAAVAKASVLTSPAVGTRGLVFSRETEILKSGAELAGKICGFFRSVASKRAGGVRYELPCYLAAAFGAHAAGAARFFKGLIKEEYAELDCGPLSDAVARYVNSHYSAESRPLSGAGESEIVRLIESADGFDGVPLLLDTALKISRKRQNSHFCKA